MNRHSMRVNHAIAAVAVAIGTVAYPFQASAQNLLCGIAEVTFSTTGSLHYPTISNDGKLVAYSSDRNPTGGNPDGNFEVFLYDTETGQTVQLTNTATWHNGPAFISGDGLKIAFTSDGDHTGENAEEVFEIFLLDLESSAITQITNTGPYSNTIESIDETGSNISFYSWNDYTGGNADLNGEIFVYRGAPYQFVQVTSSTGSGFLHGGSRLSDNGDRLVFGSFRNLTGNYPDGNYDVFLYDLVSASLTQISHTAASSSIPGDINVDGTKVVFYTTGYPSGNPEGNFELFMYYPTTGGIQQLTDSGAGQYNTQVTMSSDGNRLVFLSTVDWTGGNPDLNNEIFVLDVVSGDMTQVTNTTGVEMLYPSVSGNGERTVFTSNMFAELGNADGDYEIFLATCLPPASADLSVSLGVDRINAKQGDKITYTVTVKNFGPNNAANVIVNDALASGSTFISALANKGTFTTPAVGQSGVVSWKVGELADDGEESAQIKVTVILKGKGTITNTATVSSETTDPNTGNNAASIAVSTGSGGGGRR